MSKAKDLILLIEGADYLEYRDFCYAINNDVLYESLSSTIKDKIDFVKDLASKLKVDAKALLKGFTNSKVYKFFSSIGWSFSKLYDLLKLGMSSISKLVDIISEWAAQSKVVEWTTEKLNQLDQYLNKHPTVKKMAGLAVAGILVYIWFNMTFTGEVGYDFGMDDILLALAGKMSLAKIFGGKEGVKILLLFVTGTLGLSFPWPGASSTQFFAAIIQTLFKKLKLGVLK